MNRMEKLINIIIILIIFITGFNIALADKDNIEDDCIYCKNNDIDEYCTAVLVGKDASVDGSTMTLQTADCGNCDFRFLYIPAKEYEPDSERKIYAITQMENWPIEEEKMGLSKDNIAFYQRTETGNTIPQVERTNSYIRGIFGNINEKQLGINESTIGSCPELSSPNADISITELTLLAMERCSTAREAIKMMGSIAEKYGFGQDWGGEMLAVSDPEEVWIFEIMPVGPSWSQESDTPGAVWAAQRVPDDEVSFCPNESRIGEINLNDPDYFMASSNVVSFAVENGYYNPESGEPFRFNMAYSPQTDSAISSGGQRARMWRLFNLVASSKGFSANMPNNKLPFSIKPDKKISVRDLMTISRDNYEGTQFAPGKGVSGGPFGNPRYFTFSIQIDGEKYSFPRTISRNTAEYTIIIKLRKWLPDEIGGVLWIALGAQDTSCYMPFYAGINSIPESLTIGNHWEMNRNSARQAMDYVDFHTAVAYDVLIKDVKKAQHKWENYFLNTIPMVEKKAYELFLQNPEKARQYITDFCLRNTNQVVDAWWKLGDDLFIKYNHFKVYTIEEGQRKAGSIRLPEWYQRLIIEKNELKPVDR